MPNNIPLKGTITFCLSILQLLGCSHAFVLMNNASMNIHTHMFVWTYAFNSLGCIPKRGNIGLYDNSRFNFLRNCQTVFHSGLDNLHSYQQMRVPISPHPHQHLLLSISYNFPSAILEDIKWYLTVVLVRTALIINDIAYLFVCLMPICISSFSRINLVYWILFQRQVICMSNTRSTPRGQECPGPEDGTEFLVKWK